MDIFNMRPRIITKRSCRVYTTTEDEEDISLEDSIS